MKPFEVGKTYKCRLARYTATVLAVGLKLASPKYSMAVVFTRPDGSQLIDVVTPDGHVSAGYDRGYDLISEPEYRWINVYAGFRDAPMHLNTHPTREAADKDAGMNRVGCRRILWEPGFDEEKTA